MARGGNGGGGWVLSLGGGLLFLAENSRRVEAERAVELQAQRIAQLEDDVIRLRQAIKEKDSAILEKDRAIAALRAERDGLAQQLSVARQMAPTK